MKRGSRCPQSEKMKNRALVCVERPGCGPFVRLLIVLDVRLSSLAHLYARITLLPFTRTYRTVQKQYDCTRTYVTSYRSPQNQPQTTELLTYSYGILFLEVRPLIIPKVLVSYVLEDTRLEVPYPTPVLVLRTPYVHVGTNWSYYRYTVQKVRTGPRLGF